MSITGYAWDIASPFAEELLIKSMRNAPRPNNIGIGIYNKSLEADISLARKGFKNCGYAITGVFTVVNIGMGIEENIQNGESTGEIISDAAIDLGGGAVSIGTTLLLAKAGTAISPGWGTVIGIGVGLIYDFFIDPLLDSIFN